MQESFQIGRRILRNPKKCQLDYIMDIIIYNTDQRSRIMPRPQK
jgi:hypothetical protein